MAPRAQLQDAAVPFTVVGQAWWGPPPLEARGTKTSPLKSSTTTMSRTPGRLNGSQSAARLNEDGDGYQVVWKLVKEPVWKQVKVRSPGLSSSRSSPGLAKHRLMELQGRDTSGNWLQPKTEQQYSYARQPRPSTPSEISGISSALSSHCTGSELTSASQMSRLRRLKAQLAEETTRGKIAELKLKRTLEKAERKRMEASEEAQAQERAAQITEAEQQQRMDRLAADQEWKNVVWGVRPSQKAPTPLPAKRVTSRPSTADLEWKNTVWGAKPSLESVPIPQKRVVSRPSTADLEWKNTVWGARPSQNKPFERPFKRASEPENHTDQEWKRDVWGPRPGR